MERILKSKRKLFDDAVERLAQGENVAWTRVLREVGINQDSSDSMILLLRPVHMGGDTENQCVTRILASGCGSRASTPGAIGRELQEKVLEVSSSKRRPPPAARSRPRCRETVPAQESGFALTGVLARGLAR